ncbi:hypothetical protein O181_041281 [Austropuccinia psidii MF-1]|uniref:Uncharacterized protein n=1 Tax=Austropuccinia psidii MF-1 TaxID=1389203 RepID=A0A9Q3HE44_9BASI|nr:hypothetical protein [Austropuccinia psidii MF-1]
MPVQHSPPARQTRSQVRAQTVPTPTPRASLDGTAAVPHLRTHFGRSSIIHRGSKRAKKIKFIFRSHCKISRTLKEHSQRSWRIW